MTTTFLDSTNVTRQETIDFTTTQDVIAISVKIGSGLIVEERCYRDGVFLYPYLSSTTDGTTWALRRTGGWPLGDFRVYVDEAEAPPTGAQSWGAIYAVDFTALPSTAFATLGAHVIDGKNWYLKGAFTNSGGVIESSDLVPGSGLRITANFSMVTYGGNLANPQIYLHWWMPLAQLPDYNPLAPFVVWARMKTTPNSVSAGAFVGLGDGTNDSAGATVAHRNSTTMLGVQSATSGINNYLRAYGNVAGPSGTTLLYSTLLDGGELLGIQESTVSTDILKAVAYTAGDVDPYNTEDNTSVSDGWVRSRSASPRTNKGVYFSCNFGGGATWTFDLMELRIMQPKAT